MSTSENSDGSGTEIASERIEKKSKIPLILDGRFYAIQPEKADCMKPNVSAKCLTCNAIIKGSYRATSNFLLHIRTAHDGLEREWCEYKDSIQNSTKKRERIETTDSKVTKKRSPQKKADHLVMRYIFRAGRPLVTVDDDDFKNLVEGLSKLNEPVHCLSRKTLTKRIQKGSEEMDEDMRKELAAASYVCTTADIWSSFRRSFLGVTVHWVDPHTLTRKSAVLACKRFKGTHNYLAIVKHLTEIHDKYGLSLDKIVCTVTDNGSNFKKAFKEFHVDIDVDQCGDENDDEYTNEERTVDFADISKLYNSNDDEQYYLPKRFSCASHTLSLPGTTDVNLSIYLLSILSIYLLSSILKTLLYSYTLSGLYDLFPSHPPLNPTAQHSPSFVTGIEGKPLEKTSDLYSSFLFYETPARLCGVS